MDKSISNRHISLTHFSALDNIRDLSSTFGIVMIKTNAFLTALRSSSGSLSPHSTHTITIIQMIAKIPMTILAIRYGFVHNNGAGLSEGSVALSAV